MPQIEAFRALRYDLGHVGSLSDVVAPPYDVIGPELQDELYKRHPSNCVRLILNREEPGDDSENNRYSRAARFLKNWRSEGVLFTEPDPAVYVYHTQFEYAGKTYNRRGFMARIRLERFGEGKIYPHEETMSGPKQDRLLLTRACKANLSQVFGLYPDAEGEANRLLEEAIAGKTPSEAIDHLGVVHRIWPVTDVQAISRLAGVMGPKPIFIADGHHRYETACNYRDELAAAGPLPANHPANYVLMMCVGMSDPGMIVLPTHRLFRGLPAMNSSELVKKLGGAFTTRIVGEGADLAQTVWEEIEYGGDQGTIGLYTAADERWVIASVTDAARARMSELASEHSEDWQGLGVALLHRLVIEDLLGAKDLPKPRYVHLVDEVVAGLESDEFRIAALVTPATVDHVRQISEHRERMPAKSTYFYPKLLSGLVFNPHE
ncbi:MAG TPA: DUF1015 domain-containing protein [Pirellulales bacterium]|nr:DUF1015 domain-containing protein [Pirellulales bacterium]